MNPVLILTHNCIELTKRCVESAMNQDIPVCTAVVDNGSTDGTREWVSEQGLQLVSFSENRGVSQGWNIGIGLSLVTHNYVLVLNNDTIIPPYFYSNLLSYNAPFITGISVGPNYDGPDAWSQPSESPDFSAFLIRGEAWERVGLFDESMKHYASDCDWHIRAHRSGIKLLNAGIPFYHERSSTLRHSSADDKAEIEGQANLDRAAFKAKYGFMPWDKEYALALR